MNQNISKKQLAIVLSKLEGFREAKVRVEQYTTDSEIAADLLWNASILGDIEEKVIVDLGAGTGILGIGALLIGAKQVLFIESENSALEIAKENLELVKHLIKGKSEFILKDIINFNQKADVVIQNPPFGTKSEHADKIFLEKAFETASIIYSFHKVSTDSFIEAFSRDKGFEITHFWQYKFPIKASFDFHTKKIHRIDVGLYRLAKVAIQNK